MLNYYHQRQHLLCLLLSYTFQVLFYKVLSPALFFLFFVTSITCDFKILQCRYKTHEFQIKWGVFKGRFFRQKLLLKSNFLAIGATISLSTTSLWLEPSMSFWTGWKKTVAKACFLKWCNFVIQYQWKTTKIIINSILVHCFLLKTIYTTIIETLTWLFLLILKLSKSKNLTGKVCELGAQFTFINNKYILNKILEIYFLKNKSSYYAFLSKFCRVLTWLLSVDFPVTPTWFT